MSSEKTINQRLKTYFDTLGISAYKFSKMLGISQTGLNSAINGDNRPGVKILLALSKTDINYNWLFRGDGPMRLSDQPTIISGTGNTTNFGDNNNTTTTNTVPSTEHLEKELALLREHLKEKERTIQILLDQQKK